MEIHLQNCRQTDQSRDQVRHNTFLSANSMQAKTAKVKNFTNVHVITLKKCYLFTLFDKIKKVAGKLLVQTEHYTCLGDLTLISC